MWLTLPESLRHPKEHLCALLHILDALTQINLPKSQDQLNALLSRINEGSWMRNTALVSFAQQACCGSIVRWFAIYGVNAPVVNMALLNHIFWRPAEFDIQSIAPPSKSTTGIMCPKERIPGIIKDLERFRRAFTRLRTFKRTPPKKEPDEVPSTFENLAEEITTTRAVVDDFAKLCCQQPLEYISYHINVADGVITSSTANVA
ncbi:MAG: hypothetical protein IKZ87_08780 [Actinomycetaceae bacterium]|nr:hypothetical protein [Actinomycetaceae bacterium]